MSFRGNLFKSLWIVPIDPSPTYTPHKLCDEVGERKWRARQKNNLCGSIRCSCSDGGRVQSEDGKENESFKLRKWKTNKFLMEIFHAAGDALIDSRAATWSYNASLHRSGDFNRSRKFSRRPWTRCSILKIICQGESEGSGVASRRPFAIFERQFLEVFLGRIMRNKGSRRPGVKFTRSGGFLGIWYSYIGLGLVYKYVIALRQPWGGKKGTNRVCSPGQYGRLPRSSLPPPRLFSALLPFARLPFARLPFARLFFARLPFARLPFLFLSLPHLQMTSFLEHPLALSKTWTHHKSRAKLVHDHKSPLKLLHPSRT